MNLRARGLALLLVATNACGSPSDDECTKLREPFMTKFQANLDAAVTGGPAQGASLFGPAPDRGAAMKRELAHVRGRFVAACRALGASEIAQCMKSDRVRDENCRVLDKQLEAKLYAGFE